LGGALPLLVVAVWALFEIVRIDTLAYLALPFVALAFLIGPVSVNLIKSAAPVSGNKTPANTGSGKWPRAVCPSDAASAAFTARV